MTFCCPHDQLCKESTSHRSTIYISSSVAVVAGGAGGRSGPDYHHFITTPHQLEREGADPGPGPGLRRRADHGSSAYRGAELQLHSHSQGRGMIRGTRGSLLRNQAFSLLKQSNYFLSFQQDLELERGRNKKGFIIMSRGGNNFQ